MQLLRAKRVVHKCVKTPKAHKKAHNPRKKHAKVIDTSEKKGCISMANIRENTKNGKVISYRFIACMERDVRGKQIRKYTTWKPPEGMTAAKAKKAAERAAEQGIMAHTIAAHFRDMPMKRAF